jgi:hypothetical protein
MKKALFCVLALVFLTGCRPDYAKSFEKDVVGVFVGEIPAASDSGIAMTLNVKNGDYTLSAKFATKQKTPTVTKGKLVYVRKNVLQAGDYLFETRTAQELRMLNEEGKRIKSKLNYSLYEIWQ